MFAAVLVAALQPVSAETEGSLQSAGSFALGGIGVAGTMSSGERALREVLKNQDAVARLEALLPNASPAGRLYALLGLRIRDRRLITAASQVHELQQAAAIDRQAIADDSAGES